MTSTSITVNRWTDESDDPVVTTYGQLDDGSWRVLSDLSAPTCTLEDVMFLDPAGALVVETTGDAPSPSVLAAALPRSADYLKAVALFDTGLDDLDEDLEGGVVQVAINGRRFAPFEVYSEGTVAVTWLECDRESIGYGRCVPAGDTIAWASGIENGSMTAGTFAWWLVTIDDDFVCFVEKPDEEPIRCDVEPRNGRTDLELANAFVSYIEWEPVAAAADRAIELGGNFDGFASDFDEDWSGTCEVSAGVDFAIPERASAE